MVHSKHNIKVTMNLAAHNPEFSDGCSITELLSRIATQNSQFVRRDKRSVNLTSQNTDVIKKTTENEAQFATEKTALLQCIEKLKQNVTLDSSNNCKPPSSDRLRKSSGKNKDKKNRQIVCARNQAASPAVNRATKARRSNRLTNRTRLLISC